MRIGVYAEVLQKSEIFGLKMFLENFLNYFKKIKEVDLCLFFLKNLPIPKKAFSFEIYGSNTLPLQANRIFVQECIRKMKTNDILYWPYQKIYFFGKPSIKFIFTLHDLIPLIFPQYHSKTVIFFDFKIMLKKALKYAEKIICISYSTKEDLIKFYGKGFEEKIEVVYNGINPSIFKPCKKKDKERIKRKFGLKRYILYTGGTHPRKNVETLIKAFEEVRKKEKDLQLVITGEKTPFENVKKLVFTSPFKKDIKLLGYVSQRDLALLYSAAELYVNPSLYEGFGLGPLEAMACKVPVIHSDIKTARELFPFVPKFSPLNYKELCEKILEVLSNNSTRRQLIKKGRRLAKKYTWENTFEKYYKIFKEIAEV